MIVYFLKVCSKLPLPWPDIQFSSRFTIFYYIDSINFPAKKIMKLLEVVSTFLKKNIG